MSETRLMQILASLARRRPLRTLETICETQHQISTRKLELYLEPIGDELAGFAFNLRQDYDTICTANQRLEGEVKRLQEALESAHMALVGYLPGHRNEVTDAAIKKCQTALSTANGEVTE